jgi:hypothetical protein
LVRGLAIGGQRPHSVTFDVVDFRQLFDMRNKEEIFKYLTTQIVPALRG